MCNFVCTTINRYYNHYICMFASYTDKTIPEWAQTFTCLYIAWIIAFVSDRDATGGRNDSIQFRNFRFNSISYVDWIVNCFAIRSSIKTIQFNSVLLYELNWIENRFFFAGRQIKHSAYATTRRCALFIHLEIHELIII